MSKLTTRFWSKVDVGDADECWPWRASLRPDGYGRFAMKPAPPQSAHRVAFVLAGGELLDGDTVDHRCHTDDATCVGGVCAHRRCCNPAHLEAVTEQENKRRGRGGPATNARKTTCKRGHPLDEANTRLQVRADGSTQRACRTCINAARRAASRKE